MKYVQYGAGFSAPEEWRNFDCSPSLLAERLPLLGRFIHRNKERFPRGVEYGDVVAGLPVEKNSCRGVYASHVLEHLALDDCRRALRHTYELLEPGGIFRLVVPDLELIAKTYLNSDEPDAAVSFMFSSGLGRENRPRGLRGLLRTWLGNSAHLWMWDYESLSLELEAVGFATKRRCHFGDSQDPLFALVEDAGRFDGSLAIEATR